MTDRPESGTGQRIDATLVRTALILVLGTFMATLDIAIVTIGLDTLGRDLDASVGEIQWVTTAYLLAVVAAVPASGWLADRFGARTTWIAAMAVFLTGSVLCGLAPSLPLLVAARVVQGLGGGLLPATGQALLARTAGPNRIGRMISIAQLVIAVSPVLGPPVGGWLLRVAGWPWLFLVNVPIGLVAIGLALRYVPTHPLPVRDNRFDVVGALLLSPGLALLTFGLTGAASGHVAPSTAIATTLLAAAALVAFLRHGLRTSRTPLIDPRLFTRPPFGAAALTTAIAGASVFGGLFLLPLALQAGQGMTALSTGFLLVPQGVGALVGTLVVNRVIDRTGPRALVLAGIGLVATGTAVFTQLPTAPADALIAVSLLVRGVGIPMISAPLLTAVYRSTSPADLPRAAAGMNLTSTIGGLVGTAVLATILQLHLDAPGPGPYADTFWYALALCAVAALAATRLPARRTTPDPSDHS
ncbi:MFS transporter [Pseudonocardia sulfidoxydans NBRC 16205]|uniref:MFS transporter n=1 Tax=Pseudonocardia sulfidoxydans NBRC 16205 TaxID=1223511 RepID=A0A511DEW2_9PSEU|nr:MDR family MFS transporter [Pseudonocardia sulfidoxydans]GEL23077.1 MFS transporter [Pseudonocardia sulfidoxydans NBRC 16205]